MNDVIKEWVQKAEGDFQTAQRELAATDNPNHDAVCFHAQQCVEKLIKALLIAHRATPGKTHNLIFLSQTLHKLHPTWNPDLKDLRLLTHAAVVFRYPGETAESEDAEEAFTTATKLRRCLLHKLENFPVEGS